MVTQVDGQVRDSGHTDDWAGERVVTQVFRQMRELLHRWIGR